MYIKRNIEDDILRYADKPEIVAVIGPRQCGKTTLLAHLFSGLKEAAVFLTFEDRKILDLFERDTDAFIEQYVKPNRYIFIDEFQYARKGGKTLKFIYDTNPGKKIFITGSSAIDLTVRTLKYLVGRILVFTLHPFDFAEFLSSKGEAALARYYENRAPIKGLYGGLKESRSFPRSTELAGYFEEYVIYGGYPRVVLSAGVEEKKEILKNIFNTYFLREVKDLLGLIEDYKLSKLIESLALQTGNLINYNELGSLSGLAYLTLKKYIRFLEKTYICFFPRPFFRNKRTEILKNPKVFFFDTGLRNNAINDFRGLGAREDSGQLLENAVAMQIVRQGLTPKYWRNKQGSEVDFVIDLPDAKQAALEVKQTLAGADQASRSARAFVNSYPGIKLSFVYLERGQAAEQEDSLPAYYLG